MSKITDFDFSDLHNYPNVGILKPGSKDIGLLRFGRVYKVRSHSQQLALTEEAKRIRDYFFNEPSAEKMIEMYESYGKIYQVGKGFKSFKFWDHQKDFIHTLWDNKEVIGLMGRRLSKSTSAIMLVLYLAMSNDNYQIGMGLNRDKLLKATNTTIKQIFEGLPPFLQLGVKSYGTNVIRFSNDSEIELGIISGDLFRGTSKNFVILDEIDFSDAGEAVFDAISSILDESPTTKFLVTSTPDGKKYMYKLWYESIKGNNDLVRFKRTWEARPDRDEKWKQNQIRKYGYLAFQRNHEVSFEGSSKTLINTKTLRKIEDDDIREKIDHFQDCDFIDIFEEPIHESHIKYFIGTDTSKATETSDEDPDAIAFHVIKFDTFKMTFEQVARMHTTQIHYTETAQYLYDIGEYYRDFENEVPLVIIENNSGDGQSIADNLANTLEYDNVFYQEKRFDVWGFRTDRKSRDTILKNLKKLLEKNILIIRDDDTLTQLEAFIEIKGKFQAQTNFHDDLVMALAISFAWMIEEINEFDISLKEILQFHKIEDEKMKEKILSNRSVMNNDNGMHDLPFVGDIVEHERGELLR